MEQSNGLRIAAVSDLHGHMPEIPECDILLIPGDITWASNLMSAINFLHNSFVPWVEKIGVPVFAIAGNHDECFEPQYQHLLPKFPSNFHYLQETTTEYKGLTIFGSPWTKQFGHWSFMKDELALERHFSRMPVADIYMTHSPPYNVGDLSPYNNKHTGSRALLQKIRDNKPLLSVWGHIHSQHGHYRVRNTVACNVALVNEQYLPVYPVTVFDYVDGKIQDMID